MRKVVGACAVAVALLGALVGPGATPASATTYGCSIVVPARVSVVSPYTVITATTGSDCKLNNAVYASWDVRHSYYGPRDIYIFSHQSSNAIGFYDWDHLGTYYVEPSIAYDLNYNDLTQNSRSYVVKVGSRISLSGTRAGSYLTMKVGASYYSPNAQAFRPWQKDKVCLQYRMPGTSTWKWLATAYTDASGHAGYRFSAPTGRYYRAVTTDTGSVWGRASA